MAEMKDKEEKQGKKNDKKPSEAFHVDVGTVRERNGNYMIPIVAQIKDSKGNLLPNCPARLYDHDNQSYKPRTSEGVETETADSNAKAYFVYSIESSPTLKELKLRIEVEGTALRQGVTVQLPYPKEVELKHGKITEKGLKFVVPLIATVKDAFGNLKKDVSISFFDKYHKEIGSARTMPDGTARYEHGIDIAGNSGKKSEFSAVIKGTDTSSRVNIDIPMPTYGKGFAKIKNGALANFKKKRDSLIWKTAIAVTASALTMAFLNYDSVTNTLLAFLVGLFFYNKIGERSHSVGVLVLFLILGLSVVFEKSFVAPLIFGLFWSFIYGGLFYLAEELSSGSETKQIVDNKEGVREITEEVHGWQVYPYIPLGIGVVFLIMNLLQFFEALPRIVEIDLPEQVDDIMPASIAGYPEGKKSVLGFILSTAFRHGDQFVDIIDWLAYLCILMIHALPSAFLDILNTLGLQKFTGGTIVEKTFFMKELLEWIISSTKAILRKGIR